MDVQEVCKSYRKTKALRNISLSIRPREIFGLIGPDGSGKSSLMRAIAGVQQYNSGRIKVFGLPVASERSAERVKARIGLMPQGLGNNLYGRLSVDENIDYFAGLRMVPADVFRQRKARLLEVTRLEKFRDRPMHQLSGGMKQKLGLVCTLIHGPELVLLDEPTTGVDPVSRRDFWAILTELVQESGVTALVSTAYMDEAAYMDRLALLMEGQIISQGTEASIEALVSGTVVTFTTTDALSSADRIREQYPLVQTLGNQVRTFVAEQSAEASRNSIARLLGNLPEAVGGELRTAAPDLEDVLACLLQRQVGQQNEVEVSGATVRFTGKQDAGASSAPIQARDLVRDFGSFRAVDHVSFEVAAGRIFGLLGANGAGKTTVIKMLTGLLPPTGGAGSVAGADMHRASQAIRERIGYMSQSFSLYTDMTALENLEFYAGVYGLFSRRRKQRIPEILDMIGLRGYERRVTSDLPMGIRQRLALGCALVHRPRVVFLDEPTSGVDVLGRRQFWQILVRLAREEGVAILVTTHYMVEAEQCDELALMYAGRVIATGTPSELRQELERQEGVPLGLVTSSPLAALRAAKHYGYPRAALFGRSLRVLTQQPEQEEQRLRRLLAEQHIEVHETRYDPVTMEDVFVHSILAEEHANNAEGIEP